MKIDQIQQTVQGLRSDKGQANEIKGTYVHNYNIFMNELKDLYLEQRAH
jgi:hypothetical protein